MTSTASPPSTDPATDSGRVGRGRLDGLRRRLPTGRMRWVAVAALGVLALLTVAGVVYAWWLGGGLVRVYTTAQAKADIAQERLEKFQVSLKAGDEQKARRHLRVAEAAVEDAEDAARAAQVRVAKLLPYTRGTVSDLDHLLKAASVMIDSADEVLGVYSDFTGENATFFKDGQFDLDVLVRGRDAMRSMLAGMDTARSELRGVDGEGPLGDEALDKRRTGLKQIRQLRAEIAPFAPVVEALPDAVGASGTKRYLVAVMNPAEMRASGGAPLSAALTVFKNGKLTIPKKGTVSSITLGSPEGLLGDSPELVWKRVKGDPFQPPLGEPQRFVNTNFNPDFRVSGEQMMRATPSFFGMKTDGVIALDLVAIAKLLEVVGPIESEYGTLTSENLVQELLVDAYAEQGDDILGRQERNDQLMSTMLSTVMAGGNLRGKATALMSVAPSRHLQMYFRDDRLQRLVEDRGLDGAVPSPESGNLTAVYTQNGNGSKVDVFQQRTVDQTIRLRENGSAVVRRTVRLENPTPPYTGPEPDIKRGYLTRWATNLIINLMPPGARVTDQPDVELGLTVRKGVDQAGRTFAQAAVQTPPGGAAEVSWEYVVPRAATRQGDTLHFTDAITTQNTVNGYLLRMTVIAPDGWIVSQVEDGQPWYVDQGSGFLQIGVSEPLNLALEISPR